MKISRKWTTLKIVMPVLLVLAMLASFMMAAVPVSAAAKTWDRGANSNNWGDANNWNPNGVPAAGDTVTIGSSYTVEINQDVTQNSGGSVTVNNGATLNMTTSGVDVTFGALTIDNGGTCTVRRDLTVLGATSITGTINFGSTSTSDRSMTFIGAVTLNSGAIWNETTTGAAATFAFGNSFTNNATTFTTQNTAHTFTGSTMTISGTTATVIPTVTFSGNYTNNGTLTAGTLTVQGSGTVRLTNNGTITASTALSGSDGVTQGASGILNIGGGSAIATLTATAAGNIVNYNGAGQSVKATAYSNLILSGSGAKTFVIGTSIGGNLSIAPTGGTATASVYNGGNINANSLMLGGVNQASGTWGSTSSSATHKNNTYFASTTGIVTVATGYYPLTMAASPIAGGTATDLTNTSPYLQGATVSIHAAPATGYHFVNWTAPAGSFTSATSADTNFTMPAQAVTVTANFAANTYALTMAVSPVGGGTANDLTIASPYLQGSTVYIQAANGTGYHFVNWTAPAGSFTSSTSADTTFTMPGQAVTVTANFAIDTFKIEANASLGGTISPPGVVWVNYDGNQTFTISPAAGCRIVDVVVDADSKGPISSYPFTHVTGDHTISANFVETFTLDYFTDGNGYIDGTNPQTVDIGLDGSSVTAVANIGYHFVDWSDGILTEERTDTNVEKNISVTASFDPDTYTIAATFGMHGSIDPSGDIPVDYDGDQTFTITPDEGYHIEDVLVDEESQGALDTYAFNNVVDDHTIHATFAISAYTITFVSNGGSEVDPITQDYGTAVAPPDDPTKPGCTFAGWFSDEELTSEYTFDTMPAENITLYAAWTLNVPADHFIKVVKNTLTLSDAFEFTVMDESDTIVDNFTIDASIATDFSGNGVNDGFTGSKTITVKPGSYKVIESSVPAGWVLYSSVDQDGIEHFGQATVDVTIAVEGSETVTVEFYNSYTGVAGWPLPELPAVALMGLGLAVLGGFIFIRRKRNQAAAR